MKALSDPELLLRTVYVGDRACKAIEIDGWSAAVRLRVDRISRVRDPTGEWKFYSMEDIEDGFLVFTEVSAVSLSPSGYLPNDLINDLRIERIDEDHNGIRLYHFLVSIDAVDSGGVHTEITVQIVAKGLQLADRNGVVWS
jgi:hypothetical protein